MVAGFFIIRANISAITPTVTLAKKSATITVAPDCIVLYIMSQATTPTKLADATNLRGMRYNIPIEAEIKKTAIIFNANVTPPHYTVSASMMTTPIATATDVKAASSPLDKPLSKSPAITSRMALVIATPGTSGIIPPIMTASGLK